MWSACIYLTHVHKQGAEHVQYALSDGIASPPEYAAHWYKFSNLLSILTLVYGYTDL